MLILLLLLMLFFIIIHLFYWRTLLLGKVDVDNLSMISDLSHNVVLITSFNESEEILESTIRHAKLISNIKEIYVLDDGNRSWLKALSAKLEVKYIKRLINLDAKAGSLNNAFALIECDFALILDADMVVDDDTMSIALPHFRDDSIAIVQFPQEYYNTNSFQHWKHGEEWTDLSFGLRTVNMKRNHFKAGYWCGSPSVVRVGSLKEIGGVSVDSVTEDLATSLELMSAGFWVKTLKNKIAHCLAPTDYISYITQRQRWSKGFFQLWWNRDNPLLRKISLSAKIEWLGDFLYHIQMSFYLIIINVLPFHLCMNDYSYSDLLSPKQAIAFIVVFISVYLVNIKIAGPHYKVFQMQVYMRLSMLSVAFGFMDSLFRDNSFEVTPKLNSKDFSFRESMHKLFIVSLFVINAISVNYYIKDASLVGFNTIILLLSATNAGFLIYALRIITRKSHNPSVC